MVVVWYIANEQAKRLLDKSPLQPIREGCGIKRTDPPREEKIKSSGSPHIDEEIERVCP